MRKHKILFAAVGILLAVMLVLSACAGKEPEPDTDTGGYETPEKETTPIPAPSYASVYFEVVDYEDLYPWFV